MKWINIAFSVLLFEFIAVVLATINLKKYTRSKEKVFFYVLWLTVFTEAVGTILGVLLKRSNIWPYIIFIFITFLMYFYWYYSIIKSKQFKKSILIMSAFFIIVALKNMILESWSNYHVSTFIVGSVITVIASIFYFLELLNSNEVLKIKTSLRFWVATGLLLFNVGMVPFMVFSKQFNGYNEIRMTILISLNFILYTCYSLGFIWAKQDQNQSS